MPHPDSITISPHEKLRDNMSKISIEKCFMIRRKLYTISRNSLKQQVSSVPLQGFTPVSDAAVLEKYGDMQAYLMVNPDQKE
jgi:hypothetical protein